MCSTLRPDLMMHVAVMQRRIDWAAGWLLRAQRQRIFGVAVKRRVWCDSLTLCSAYTLTLAGLAVFCSEIVCRCNLKLRHSAISDSTAVSCCCCYGCCLRHVLFRVALLLQVACSVELTNTRVSGTYVVAGRQAQTETSHCRRQNLC